MTKKEYLTLSASLSAVDISLRLDAEVLLSHILKKPRSYFLTHPNAALSLEHSEVLNALMQRRKQGEPLAYLLGYKEFWSLELEVNSNVLVPRPETEHLIEWALAHFPEKEALLLADLGTGSGAIAIALAHSRPMWKIHASDFSKKALNIAEKNAAKFSLTNQISFFEGAWCTALPLQKYHAIFSNPPYIAKNDPHLAALSHEPMIALIAEENGLKDLRDIILQARSYLLPGGLLILEHGYDQAAEVTDFLNHSHYQNIRTFPDLAGLPRFTIAKV